jgi:hypothetical protein
MSQSNEPSVQDMKDRLGRVTGWLEHENALLNQRMGWMLTLQGLLFAAAAVLFNNEGDVFPILVIAALGILSSISIFSTVQGGCHILDALNQERRALHRQLDEAAAFNPLFPSEKPRSWIVNWVGHRLLYPWRALPVLLFFSWVALTAYVLLRR